MRIAALLLLCALTACVRVPPQPGGADPILAQARGETENRRLYTDLIREMIAQDRLYAALAHLQAQEQRFGVTPDLRLLRAEVLRKLGRPVEAEQFYRGLLAEGVYRGQAHHGLGLIYARQDLDLGIRHLQTAAALLPTDAAIRNDLGYALLKQGQIRAAQMELATAFQLKNGVDLARNNYILVLLVAGEEGKAQRIAAQSRVDAETMTRLRQQAGRLQSQARAPTPPPAQATGAPRPAAAVAVQGPRIGGGGG